MLQCPTQSDRKPFFSDAEISDERFMGQKEHDYFWCQEVWGSILFVLDAFLYVCMVRCGGPAEFMRLGKLDIIEVHVPWCCCLKKNLDASRPSEHPPVKEKNVKTFSLGGIIGCKDKTSSWHLNGFPDGRNIGSSIISGRNPPLLCCTLNFYINRHAGTPDKTQQKHCSK